MIIVIVVISILNNFYRPDYNLPLFVLTMLIILRTEVLFIFIRICKTNKSIY